MLQSRPTPWHLPKDGSGLGAGRWLQSLTLEHKEKSIGLLAVIESDGKNLTLVGLSPMGQRLMRITWSEGKVQQETDPHMPVAIDGEAILRDVVLVNWPEEILWPLFAKTEWKVTFDGPKRELYWGHRLWLSVKPDSFDGAKSILVDHHAEGYKVHVSLLEHESP